VIFATEEGAVGFLPRIGAQAAKTRTTTPPRVSRRFHVTLHGYRMLTHQPAERGDIAGEGVGGAGGAGDRRRGCRSDILVDDEMASPTGDAQTELTLQRTIEGLLTLSP